MDTYWTCPYCKLSRFVSGKQTEGLSVVGMKCSICKRDLEKLLMTAIRHYDARLNRTVLEFRKEYIVADPKAEAAPADIGALLEIDA